MRISWSAVYVLWLRELKRFSRAKAQIVSMLMMPLLFLISFGMGFSKASLPGMEGINYMAYIVPGIIGMSLMMRSAMTGFSVLWDREFGFLKEIMVAPVNRISIVFGRIAGGMTTALIQGLLVMLISMLIGFKITDMLLFLPALLIMTLISITFIGLGLIFASLMKDMQGFNMIMNLIILPLFFLSGAFYPVTNLPEVIRWISYIDPLTYAVDGLRAAFLGSSVFPLIADIAVLIGTSIMMVLLGAYLFEKSESV